MMVTELEQCGSLADCIKKRSEPSEKTKTKVMLDIAKELAYLDRNPVLHWDVKPDNVLEFSLNKELTVNVKLMDFRSSRNVVLLKTNMTFTMGIGNKRTWRRRF